jgi:hypothetical protein
VYTPFLTNVRELCVGSAVIVPSKKDIWLKKCHFGVWRTSAYKTMDISKDRKCIDKQFNDTCSRGSALADHLLLFLPVLAPQCLPDLLLAVNVGGSKLLKKVATKGFDQVLLYLKTNRAHRYIWARKNNLLNMEMNSSFPLYHQGQGF